MKTLLCSVSLMTLVAMSPAALARAELSDAQMERIAAGAGSAALTSTVNQTANSTSTATCTNCSGTASGAAPGVAVSSGSQAINITNVHEVLTGAAGKNATGPVTVSSTVNQTANSTSTATCTNCTGTGSGTGSGIAVSSGSQAVNLANVHLVVTGGAVHKATGPITVSSTINQIANSSSTATCTNCTGTAGGTGSGIGVSSGSLALNVANVDLVVGGGPKAQGAVTLSSTVNQLANSGSTAACTSCTGTGASGVGVSSGSQALNIANIRQVAGGLGGGRR